MRWNGNCFYPILFLYFGVASVINSPEVAPVILKRQSHTTPRIWARFFILTVAVCLIGGPSPAVTPGTDPAGEYGIRIARVKYGGGGDWYSDPSSIPNWLREFEARTGIKTYPEEKVISLTDENLRAFPFLYMTGHGTIRATVDELKALRRHLESGGFLYADDNYGMDKSFREFVRQLFPEKELEELANSHPIYHVFYKLPGLPKIHEHDGKRPQGMGVTLNGRLVLFYTYESDIGDGLEDPRVHDDPDEKRELAVRMAVNILMYAIAQNALP
jgi:hypothetical protein